MRCARDFRRLTRVFREKRAKNTCYEVTFVKCIFSAQHLTGHLLLFKDMTASGKSLVNSVSGSLPNCYTWIGYTQANGPPRVLLSRDVDRNGTAPTRCFSQITQTLGDCKAPSRYRHSVVAKLRFAVYRRSRSALQAFWRSAGGKGQSPKTSGEPQYSGRGLPAYNKCAVTEEEVQFCAGFPLSARSRHAGRDVKSRELWNKSSAARLYAANNTNL